MNIAVFGLGYVGLTAAGCLTSEGHRVLGVDTNESKVRQTNEGLSPIKEPGLDALISQAVANGLLRCTTDCTGELDECEMAIVCVGTPSGQNGAHNMTFIAEVSRQIAESLNRSRATPLTVVYRSTISPGTTEELIHPIFQSVLGDRIDAIELVYNPEFLRESTGIQDYFEPPKIVIGTSDGRNNFLMDKLYSNIKAPVFYTRYREAEITKFVDNSFHALKISFANEIGRICKHLDISAKTVHKIFISDTKLNISTYYTRPGNAFGGSCLPKDVRALQYISADVGAGTYLIESLIRSNEAHKHFLFELCTKDVQKGAKVLMVGLAFKADSDDLRESPSVDLARRFLREGYNLSVYDPSLKPSQLVGQNLGYAFMQLPSLKRLLVDDAALKSENYDVVVDTNGTLQTLTVNARKTVNINALE